MNERDADKERQLTMISKDEARVAETGIRYRARSRRIHRLRRVLPLLIILIAGSAVAWTVFRTVMSGVERRATESRELRLDNPQFHGQDAQGRSFLIGAKGAVRVANTGQYKLIGPMIRLNLGGNKVTELTADGGVYDEARRSIVIGPNVKIMDGASGFNLVTPEAVVDTQTGIVTGDKGVEGTSPIGTIKASAYAIYDEGRRIEFLGQGEQKISGTIQPAESGR